MFSSQQPQAQHQHTPQQQQQRGEAQAESEAAPASQSSLLAWCSWCMARVRQRLKTKNDMVRSVYECTQCQNRTLPCRNECGAMAKGGIWDNEWCSMCDGSLVWWPGEEYNLQRHGMFVHQPVYAARHYRPLPAAQMCTAYPANTTRQYAQAPMSPGIPSWEKLETDLDVVRDHVKVLQDLMAESVEDSDKQGNAEVLHQLAVACRQMRVRFGSLIDAMVGLEPTARSEEVLCQLLEVHESLLRVLDSYDSSFAEPVGMATTNAPLAVPQRRESFTYDPSQPMAPPEEENGADEDESKVFTPPADARAAVPPLEEDATEEEEAPLQKWKGGSSEVRPASAEVRPASAAAEVRPASSEVQTRLEHGSDDMFGL